MIDRFTSRGMRRTPDQTVYGLNQLSSAIEGMKSSLRITSSDGSDIIVIGNQPIDPTTKQPYPFGIRRYAVKGDRLELIGEVQWT